MDIVQKKKELQIVQNCTNKFQTAINQILDNNDIANIKEEIQNIHIDEQVQKYMIELIFASRNPLEYEGLEEVAEYLEFGASPRGSIDLFKASKAYAYLKQKDFVSPDDIAMIIKSVLRHRIVLNFNALSKNITTDMIIDTILQKVIIP